MRGPRNCSVARGELARSEEARDRTQHVVRRMQLAVLHGPGPLAQGKVRGGRPPGWRKFLDCRQGDPTGNDRAKGRLRKRNLN
jgi:hypothetical protein